MNPSTFTARKLALAILLVLIAVAPPRTHAVILDNSFFIEEAYNQETRVVQHIQTIHSSWERRTGGTARAFSYGFTQEWPLGSQRHQLSYTIPYERRSGNQQGARGIGDVQVHYRLQALGENEAQPALAPRFTVVLPTGNSSRGLGAGTPGIQVNIPASKKVGWAHLHANAGATIFPDARITLSSGVESPPHDLMATNLGFSTILLLGQRLNILLEVVTNTEESIGESGETEREVRAFASPGLRFAIDRKEGVQWVLGAAAPFGLSDAADDFALLLYTSFEHPF